MKKAVIISLIVFVSLTSLVLFARARMNNTPSAASNGAILELTYKNFQAQTKDKIILVDFWATWCAPCRMMSPVIAEIAGEVAPDTFVGKVDVDSNQTLAQKFQVNNIPTMILFKNGKEVGRFVGVQTREFLLEQIRNLKKKS